MNTSLTSMDLSSILKTLDQSNKDFSKIYPGESGNRQPIQTVYGGAHLFKYNTAQKLGESSVEMFNEYLGSPDDLVSLLNIDHGLAKLIHEKVKSKLSKEAVEDFRIDFEDGYGIRPDDEEDQTAIQAANEVIKGMRENTLPPFLGIRLKAFSNELVNRSIRTLDLFISTIINETGSLPDNFVITLPKPVHIAQVKAFDEVLNTLESKIGLSNGTLKIELMVEMPQIIINKFGYSDLRLFVEAANGRCIAAHFGVYDYTASANITATYQGIRHPACDFAREVMKISLSNTGIFLSDGASNLIPVGQNRPTKGEILTKEQVEENKNQIFNVWHEIYLDIRHSLKSGYYQGWDLHPGHFIIRYIAFYTFFLESQVQASLRLKTFVEMAAKATLVGQVFDDAATGQALLNFFLRGLNCGAFTDDDIKSTGLTIEEVEGKSFLKILENRKKL